MEYNVLIIDSYNYLDYMEERAEGVKYFKLSKEEVDTLMELSLKQDFSVIIQKYEKED